MRHAGHLQPRRANTRLEVQVRVEGIASAAHAANTLAAGQRVTGLEFRRLLEMRVEDIQRPARWIRENWGRGRGAGERRTRSHRRRGRRDLSRQPPFFWKGFQRGFDQNRIAKREAVVDRHNHPSGKRRLHRVPGQGNLSIGQAHSQVNPGVRVIFSRCGWVVWVAHQRAHLIERHTLQRSA